MVDMIKIAEVVLGRIVTLDGQVACEGPNSDFVFGDDGVPVFNFEIKDTPLRWHPSHLVQLITISIPPTPTKVWIVKNGKLIEDPNT